MKLNLNGRDLASGLILMAIAFAGLYLNLDHNLGSARRMGPGYMPAMVFWLQAFLGALVVFFSLMSGPDPLERWTGLDIGTFLGGIVAGLAAWWIAPSIWGFFGQTYNAVGVGMTVGFFVMAISSGWKMLAIICASVSLFGLLFEQAGFFIGLTALIVVACLAEHTHTKKGIAGVTLFLLALCWWVFIYELDIRVNLWPQT